MTRWIFPAHDAAIGNTSPIVDVLQLRDLEVRYDNGALGVEDVSVALAPGRVVGLFGANGAGKSTTVRAASGFLRSERVRITGQVWVDSRELAGAEPDQFVRAGVAAIPERRKVFPRLTVRDNLIASFANSGRADHARRLKHVLDLFPVLEERIDVAAGLLSGGEQQMLAIARGTLLGVRYLIIDEMSLGLHPSLWPILFDAVREIADRGTGVLIVDENVDETLEIAEYCYLLTNGAIEFEGTALEFRKVKHRIGFSDG